MNFRRLVSAVAALAVAGSVCAGVAVTASADNTIYATLDHTASAPCFTNASRGVTVDAEEEYFNIEGSSGYVAYAFAQFSFEIPEGENISSATLTFGGTSTKGYNSALYYLNAGQTFTFDASELSTDTNYRYYGVKTSINSTVQSLSGGVTGITQDVTAAVSAIATAGQDYIIFQWTGNNGGASLYGKASTYAPTLTIVTSASATYTVTYDVNGTETSETVVSGNTPISVPTVANYTSTTDKAEYTFVGWDNGEEVLTADEVAATAITADTTYTATYSSTDWDEDSLYQDTVTTVTLSNSRNSSYTIGADVSGETKYSLNADVAISYTGDSTTYLGILFLNENGETVAGLMYYATGLGTSQSYSPNVYFVTDGSFSTGGSGQMSPDTVGSDNYALIVEEGTASGTINAEFVVDTEAKTVTLTYGGTDYVLPLNNSAETIASIHYGGYRYNSGTISNIYVKEVKDPAITTSADTDKTVTAAAIGEAVTAKLVGNESTTLELASTDTVYTIWVKVENSTEQPTVTITDNTGAIAAAEATMAEVFESGDYTGYYCIQILPDTLLTGGTVTFSVTGATSETITLN